MPSDTQALGHTHGSPPVLAVRDLRTHFHTEAGIIRAVNGVDLTVREGETLAVVGESGSGKSVTGLTVMRLLGRTSARVEGGTIRFSRKSGEELDLLALPEREMQKVRGRDVAMIFQDPMSSLNPVFTVGDQIAEPIRIHEGLGRREARERALDLLRQVGISDPDGRIDAYPHQLSGGMRQRVMIAVALACDPRLLIADEPTTALDVTIQSQIVTLLKRLQTERRMAMIFVTHDLKLVGEIADRVAVMYASQVVEEGPVAEVLASPKHPYTRALLDCIPSRRDAAGNRRQLRPIPGVLPNPLSPPEGCHFHPRCVHAQPRCAGTEPVLERVSDERQTRCLPWREIAA
ncbi:ABC transporter ATP-binding protein [Mangrovicella endophytica]|uniref:ABC transporter ATP-binding protein n=1 Tax=Mangrovicella endophytica TaxID=2066697 RepID=UPI000C9EA9CB|nr:ABC transporter ATP-binding protein [Mangrovicella endophytica]